MTFASPSRPILIEFAAAPSSRPRANHANRQSLALSSPQSASTSQLYTSTSIRRDPIILTYRSPRRTESQSLLETDAQTLSGILEAPHAKDNDETLSFVHPAELHQLLALENERAEFSENVAIKSQSVPNPKSPRRRIFGWALTAGRNFSSLETPLKGGSGPSHTISPSPLRPKAPLLTISPKRKSELPEKLLDLSQRKSSTPSPSKSFHISSLPSRILSKRETSISSPNIFCRKKKPKFEPEPIEPPEKRQPPPPLPPHLRQDVHHSFDQEAAQRQRPSSLIDSLSLGSSFGYDYYEDDEFDPQIVAFGPEVLLEDDEDDLSSMTGDDSATEPEEAITPSSSHPYALVGFPSTVLMDEDEQDGVWDDVVVLEHTLEEYVLANPISLNLQLAPPHRRSSCPSSTSSKRRPRSSRSHRRPSVPLRLPRSVSSVESIKNLSNPQNEIGSSKPYNSPLEARLRPPLVIETLLDDSDADFLDLHESTYSRTVSSLSRRGSFLSDNREDFLDLEWSSAGDESSLRMRG